MADEAKVKKAKKALEREKLEKLRHAERKAGLPKTSSPEPSISESEGDEDPSWLNELLTEESPI